MDNYFFVKVLADLIDSSQADDYAIPERYIGLSTNGYSYWSIIYGNSSLFAKIGYCIISGGTTAVTYVKGSGACHDARVTFIAGGSYKVSSAKPLVNVLVSDDIYRVNSNPIGIGMTSDIHPDITIFNSLSELDSAINDGNWNGPAITCPITYRLTNCTIPDAPNEAVVGNTVTLTPVFTEGYGILNSADDVYVMCNGVIVPSTYLNGVLSFTMPDPS